MPSPELKPCPFCGAEAEIMRAADEYEFVVAVNCTECSAHVRETDDHIGRDMDALEAEAVAAWNKRAVDLAAIVKAGRGMKKCLEELIETFGAFYEDGRIDYGCAMVNINIIKRTVAAWNRRAGEEAK